MYVSFALLADAANLSQEGKLNVLGVFDAVQVANLPAVHPRASLVVHLKGDRQDVGRHQLGLRWVGPSGQELWSTEGDMEVRQPPEGGSVDVPVIAVVDLPLDQPGAYAMHVLLDGRPAATVPMHARAALPPVALGTLLS